MLLSIEGRYSNGKIELSESPQVPDDTRVIVTFLENGENGAIDLRQRGIDEEQAASLRQRLSTFVHRRLGISGDGNLR